MSFISFGEHKLPRTSGHQEFLTAFRCGGCHGGYLSRSTTFASVSPHTVDGDADVADHIAMDKGYPEKQIAGAPPHLPDNISSFFLQAKTTLIDGHLDASGMMARKTLEVACKTLDEGTTGNLYQRIEKLHLGGLITDALKEWAHIIRDDGNGVAHDQSPADRDFAENLVDFCELFLLYTFTMPHRVQTKMAQVDE